MIIKHCYNYRKIIRFIAVCYCLELLYKLNEYVLLERECLESLNQEPEFLTSTKNLTLKTKKSTNLPERRFFVHQAFNMNPINFVDPLGTQARGGNGWIYTNLWRNKDQRGASDSDGQGGSGWICHSLSQENN
jgi:hypothetical protein